MEFNRFGRTSGSLERTRFCRHFDSWCSWIYRSSVMTKNGNIEFSLKLCRLLIDFVACIHSLYQPLMNRACVPQWPTYIRSTRVNCKQSMIRIELCWKNEWCPITNLLKTFFFFILMPNLQFLEWQMDIHNVMAVEILEIAKTSIFRCKEFGAKRVISGDFLWHILRFYTPFRCIGPPVHEYGTHCIWQKFSKGWSVQCVLYVYTVQCTHVYSMHVKSFLDLLKMPNWVNLIIFAFHLSTNKLRVSI